MKTLRLLALILTACCPAQGGFLFVNDDGKAEYTAVNPYPADRLRSDIARASVNPFRRAGKEAVDLVPLFRYFESAAAGERPMPEWRCLIGTVLQATAHEGLLMEVKSGPMEGLTVYVTGYPGNRLIDDVPVCLFARDVGTHAYESVGSGTCTVRAFDYGEVIVGKTAETMAKKYVDQSIAGMKAREEAEVRRKAASEEKKRSAEEAVRKFREEQATKVAEAASATAQK